MKVFVVVLGDVSRSPRMQYHALSMAKEGCDVTVVGHQAGQPLMSLLQNPHVSFQYVANSPEFKRYLPTFLAYIAKALWLTFALLYALIIAGRPDVILVQNPPAVPALGLCWFYARLLRAKYIIDWHNYAYSILALSLPSTHRLVRIYERFEFFFGRRSDGNLCVTQAMREDLKEKGVTASTLHDSPAEHFKPLEVSEKHDFLRKLGQDLPLFVQDCADNETVLTRWVAGSTTLREDRPAVLISSTSWTEDEDFSLLLDALQAYELAKEEGADLPRLLVIITGSGPLKEFYKAIIARRHWKQIQVITPWLTAEDYPRLIACGDLGICLHKSSSGLDLPMKVLDMYGCGLPVAAVNFKCLGELVQHKVHGTVFNTSGELSDQLQDWFRQFPAPSSQEWRHSIPDNIRLKRTHQWHANWCNHAWPIFKQYQKE